MTGAVDLISMLRSTLLKGLFGVQKRKKRECRGRFFLCYSVGEKKKKRDETF